MYLGLEEEYRRPPQIIGVPRRTKLWPLMMLISEYVCSMIIQRAFASQFALPLYHSWTRETRRVQRGTFVSDDSKCHGTQRAAGLSEWTEHNWAERWDQTLKNAAIAALSTEAVQITHTYMQLRYTMGRCERFSLSWAQTYQRSYALGVLYCRISEKEATYWLIPSWCNG